jgi:hypothetical protein
VDWLIPEYPQSIRSEAVMDEHEAAALAVEPGRSPMGAAETARTEVESAIVFFISSVELTKSY